MPCSESLKLSLILNLADNLYIIMAIKLANDVAYSTAFEPDPDCKAENQPALLSPVIIRKNGINITIELIGTIMYLADGFSPGFIETSAVSLLIIGTAFLRNKDPRNSAVFISPISFPDSITKMTVIITIIG